MRTRSLLTLAAIAGATLLSLVVVSSDALAQDQGQFKGKGKGKARPPSRPTPHWADGRLTRGHLGPLPGEKGVWAGNAGSTLATNDRRGGIDNNRINLPTNLKVSDVPF